MLLSWATAQINNSIKAFEGPDSPQGELLKSLYGTTPDGVDATFRFPASRPIILLSVEKTCEYCSQNWPWWNKIQARLKDRVDFRVLDVGSSYALSDLKTLGIGAGPILRIDKIESTRLRFNQTPTTALVNRSGMVVRAWSGVFDKDRLTELEKLAHSTD